MSAAEPADHIPPVVNAAQGSNVLDFTRRAVRMAAGTGVRRWAGVNHASGRGDQRRPGHAAPDGPERSPAGQFADDIEAGFASIDHTLTDEQTAEVYVFTLEVVGRTLQGAEATGMIGKQELAKLADLIDGMKAVPTLL